jgi:hypothetical protein
MLLIILQDTSVSQQLVKLSMFVSFIRRLSWLDLLVFMVRFPFCAAYSQMYDPKRPPFAGIFLTRNFIFLAASPVATFAHGSERVPFLKVGDSWVRKCSSGDSLDPFECEYLQ